MIGSLKTLWTRRRRSIVVVVLVAVGLLLVGLVAVEGGPLQRVRSSATGTQANSGSPGREPISTSSAAGAVQPEPYSADSANASDSKATNDVNAALPPLDPTRFLVQTGDVTVYVRKGDVAVSAARVTAMADGLGGYVLRSDLVSGSDGQRPSAVVTVRVPAQNFQEAIGRVGRLGEVKALQTEAQDVTGQYVDLKARLAHYRAVEQRLLTFLARATSIEQALAIQQRIDHTQLTVEELTAQVKAMREQVTYGTLTVALSERPSRPVIAPTRHGTFIAAFLHSARLLGVAARSLFVALGAAIPFAALVAVLGWLGWMLAKRSGLLPPRHDTHNAEVGP
jgi:hypothetical protein